MPVYTRFTGISNDVDNSLLQTLEVNLKEFFNWGFLEAGFYTDIDIQDLGVDADVPENLQPVHSPSSADGIVFQAPYRHFVHERNLESSRQPIFCSGVYIDGTFHNTASATGLYEHYINFPEGQVVFKNSLMSSGSLPVVQANYSCKRIGIYDQTVPWFRELLFDSFDFNHPTNNLPSGTYNLLKNYAVQVPFVLIETIPDRKFIPKQLGDVSNYVHQDFLFHIFAEDSATRNNLVDIVTLQKEKTLYLFDINSREEENTFTLDYRGSPLPDGKFYNELVEPYPVGYQFKKGWFSRMNAQSVSSLLPAYRAVIRVTFVTDYI